VFIPRSGYVPEPRVASTLGMDAWYFFNRNAVAPVPVFMIMGHLKDDHPGKIIACGRNPFRLDGYLRNFPGLKQPWALGPNRFAV
jgi:hypothetical protein